MEKSIDEQIIDKVIKIVETHLGSRIKGWTENGQSGSNSLYILGTSNKTKPITELKEVKDFTQEIKKLPNCSFEDNNDWRNRGKYFCASDIYKVKLKKGEISICFDINNNDWIQISVFGNLKNYFNKEIARFGNAEEYAHDVIHTEKGHYKKWKQEQDDFWAPHLSAAQIFAKKYNLSL